MVVLYTQSLSSNVFTLQCVQRSYGMQSVFEESYKGVLLNAGVSVDWVGKEVKKKRKRKEKASNDLWSSGPGVIEISCFNKKTDKEAQKMTSPVLQRFLLRDTQKQELDRNLNMQSRHLMKFPSLSSILR